MLTLFCILLSVFSVTLSDILQLNYKCEDIYKHSNWHLLEDKEYCATYDLSDQQTDVYTILDPQKSETPFVDDSEENWPSSRILRGLRVGRNEYPWIAQLLWSQYLERGPFCGGSLISKRYVLTAAHCVIDAAPDGVIRKIWPTSEVTVRLGANKRLNKCDEDRICREFEDFEVEEITIPDPLLLDQAFFSWDLDIALIRLKTDSGFAKGIISPICLPKCSMLHKVMYGNKMVVAGFGATNEEPTVELPDFLQKFYTVVKSSEQCSHTLDDPYTVVCSGEISQNQSASCHGDSGSPLMLLALERKNKNEEPKNFYYHFGVLSRSYGKCEKGAVPFRKDTIYIRVAAFMPWILDHIRE